MADFFPEGFGSGFCRDGVEVNWEFGRFAGQPSPEEGGSVIAVNLGEVAPFHELGGDEGASGLEVEIFSIDGGSERSAEGVGFFSP